MKYVLPSALSLSVVLVALIGSASAATPTLDEVRKLLPPGTDVAGVAIAALQASSETAVTSISSQYIASHDLNGDGIPDLAVIVEDAPQIMRNDIWDHEEPCVTYDVSKCTIIGGARRLEIFLGCGDGGFKLFETSTDKLVFTANDGGVKGDPLEPISVSAKGSISISTWGGSSDVWSYTDVIQFRKDGFYMIGRSAGGYSSFDPEQSQMSTDTNLITGAQIRKKGIRTIKTRVPLKPLVRLKDFVNADM